MEIETIIESLPHELQDYIKDGVWLMPCAEIARRNNFSEEAAEVLKGEVLLGIADRELREELRISLVESLRIPGILANDIAKEIEEKVFREVRLIEPPLLDEGNEHLLVPSSADTPAGAPGIAPEPSSTAAEPVAAAPSTAPETEKPLMPRLEKETPPVAVPPKSAVDAKLAELRQAAEKAAMEKQYPGNDPYREPIA
jgi:hypothetical protein